MKKILITGFTGNKNSSKVLLDNLGKIINNDLLYLDNDFEVSEKQFKDKIIKKTYDVIFSFGQKPTIKSVYIEKTAKNGIEKLETNYNFTELKNFLEKQYRVKISEDAGNYLCNNIYYKGLQYIYDNKIETKLLFIHIPYLKNMDIKNFSELLSNHIKNMQREKVYIKTGKIYIGGASAC